MLQSTSRREAGTIWVDAANEDQQRRRMVIAIVLLLVAITAVLLKDRDSWFGSDETPTAEDAQPVSSPSATAQAPVSPGAQATAGRTALSPMKVAGNAHRTAQPASNSVKVEIPRNLGSASARSTSATWGPATTAAERVRTSPNQVQAFQQSVDGTYPLLAGQMAVQGSVLLQALIGADGTVEDLRVLSGPTILVSAAREAVLQWRFKPYLQNGKPVETQARVTVSFTIKVSNTGARYQLGSVSSAGAL